MATRLLAYYPLIGERIYIDDGAGSISSVVLTSGTYLISAASLIAGLNSKLGATAWSASLSADGHIILTKSAGASFIVWSSPGDGVYNTHMRDYLGFTGSSTSVTTTAPLWSPAYVDLDGDPVDDVEKFYRIGTQSLNDTSVYTLLHDVRKERMVKLLYMGAPRDDDADIKYHNMCDFYQWIVMGGHRFRYYPDTTETTSAWDRLTNPYGYQIYTAIAEGYEPEMLTDGWYGAWTVSMRMIESPEPADLV